MASWLKQSTAVDIALVGKYHSLEIAESLRQLAEYLHELNWPLGPEWYASLRTQSAMERSEVAMVLIDASEELSEQDVRIIAKGPLAAAGNNPLRAPR